MYVNWGEQSVYNGVLADGIPVFHSALTNPLPGGGIYARGLYYSVDSVNQGWLARCVDPALQNIPITKSISMRASVRARCSPAEAPFVGVVGLVMSGPAGARDAGAFAGVGTGKMTYLGPNGFVTTFRSYPGGTADAAFPEEQIPGAAANDTWVRVRLDRIPWGTAADQFDAYTADVATPETWVLRRSVMIPSTSPVYLGWPCQRVGFWVGAQRHNVGSRGYIDNIDIYTADV